MSYYFVGYQVLNFDTKEGSKIDGTNIFVLFKDENTIGQKSDKKFIDRKDLEKMRINLDSLIGKNVQIFCDLKGHPVLIQEIKSAA